ncbi:MAG: hypothetical protein GX495_15175 [Chloroflexi bacterium]|jgi:uncharacterized protein YaaQ|nr:hypothetical protein [Chloroflexota bacterium]
MKLIMAVIRDSDNDAVSQALIEAGFRVTRIASTGGFLRRGLSTLIIGVSADRVDQAIEIIRQSTAPAVEPGMRRATLFVLPVDQYTQI